MRDVAEMAGVSKSTVSKILNNKGGVSEQVKQKVLNCCEELGYQLNWNIQDLIRINKSRRSQNIAFIMCGLEFADPAYSRFLDGIAASATAHNFHVILTKITGREDKIFDLPPVLRDRRIDGILISGYLNQTTIELLEKLDVPFIILGNYGSELTKHSISVEIDLAAAMNGIVSILRQQNKCRPLYFDESFDIFYSKSALEYYKSSLTEYNMEFHQELCYGGNGAYTSSCQYFTELFTKNPPEFDSIVCLDFRSAQHLAYYIISKHGYRGAAGTLIATARLYDYYTLPLPAIYVNPLFNEIAYDAMRILVDIINGNENRRPRSLVLKPEVEFIGTP